MSANLPTKGTCCPYRIAFIGHPYCAGGLFFGQQASLPSCRFAAGQAAHKWASCASRVAGSQGSCPTVVETWPFDFAQGEVNSRPSTPLGAINGFLPLRGQLPFTQSEAGVGRRPSTPLGVTSQNPQPRPGGVGHQINGITKSKPYRIAGSLLSLLDCARSDTDDFNYPNPKEMLQ